jgi:DNA adenine methylase
MKVTRPALRYHGAKFRLAPWLLQYFPQHSVYTEAFGGAAGVLIQKPRAHGEVYNDLDGDVVNFFRVVRDPVQRAALIEAVTFTPYARAEFELAWEHTEDSLERARRTAVRAQMGFGSAGATKGSTGMRTDLHRRFTTAQQDWVTFPEAIRAVGERFAGVLVENRPAIDVMRMHDGPDTLHYVDPPYVHSTRVMRKQGGYRHELTDAAQRELLDVLVTLKGIVILSGYESSMYTECLQGWPTFQTDARISAGRGTAIRTEVIWMNKAAYARRPARELFEGAA